MEPLKVTRQSPATEGEVGSKPVGLLLAISRRRQTLPICPALVDMNNKLYRVDNYSSCFAAKVVFVASKRRDQAAGIQGPLTKAAMHKITSLTWAEVVGNGFNSILDGHGGFDRVFFATGLVKASSPTTWMKSVPVASPLKEVPSWQPWPGSAAWGQWATLLNCRLNAASE